MSVCALPSCVPQQAGLFTEGLLCSLTKKMLIQHIPSIFTYRKKRVGRESCVWEPIWYHPIGFLFVRVCVLDGSAEPNGKWLLPVCEEVVKRAFFYDGQTCKQEKSEREGEWPSRRVRWQTGEGVPSLFRVSPQQSTLHTCNQRFIS